jgi:GNAT superfamily N-acetyltransferase
VIRKCHNDDLEAMAAIVNAAAEAYRGVIPADRWHDPYMPLDELCAEIERGVRFSGYAAAGTLVGLMGLEDVQDVHLIRHAYVHPDWQGHGIGSQLARHLYAETTRPVLVGTWADAQWAVHFYERQGFRQVPAEEAKRLLRTYWAIPERQVDTSVVLADERWWCECGEGITT